MLDYSINSQINYYYYYFYFYYSSKPRDAPTDGTAGDGSCLVISGRANTLRAATLSVHDVGADVRPL